VPEILISRKLKNKLISNSKQFKKKRKEYKKPPLSPGNTVDNIYDNTEKKTYAVC